MYCLKKGVINAAIVSAIVLSGCASTQSDQDKAEMQRSAMARWNACIERNFNDDQVTAMQVSKLMNNQCEGYRRDIIALFPAHMIGQVDQVLVSSAYRLIDSRHAGKTLPAENNVLVRTLLR